MGWIAYILLAIAGVFIVLLACRQEETEVKIEQLFESVAVERQRNRALREDLQRHEQKIMNALRREESEEHGTR